MAPPPRAACDPETADVGHAIQSLEPSLFRAFVSEVEERSEEEEAEGGGGHHPEPALLSGCRALQGCRRIKEPLRLSSLQRTTLHVAADA